jgi:hypothetical protein
MAKNLRNSIITSLNIGLRQSLTSGLVETWTPALLSGLQLWLDADDASTITESSGSVSQWDDKSGNGNDAVQGTGAREPSYGSTAINSKNVVNFSGGKFMTTGYPPALNRTIAMVVRYSNLTQLEVAMGARESIDERSYFGINQGRVRAGVANLSTLSGTSGIATYTTYTQILKHGQGAVNREVHHYLDGTEDIDQTFTGDIGSGQNYMIGGFNDRGGVHNQQYDGLMGEMIITGNMMGDSDRQKLEGYLAHKWGHTASLPADHPYKSSTPTA